MAKPGPPKKPTAQRVLEGNPGKLAIPKDEPKPKISRGLKPPPWMKGEARKLWQRIVPELESTGVLAGIDREVLATYCKTWETYCKAQQFLDKNGLTWIKRDKDGDVCSVSQFPQVVIARNAANALRMIASEYGLTPASRPGIAATPKPENPFGDLLN